MLARIPWKYRSTLFAFSAAIFLLVSTFLGGYGGYILSNLYVFPLLILIGGFVGLTIGGIVKIMILGYIHEVNYSESLYLTRK